MFPTGNQDIHGRFSSSYGRTPEQICDSMNQLEPYSRGEIPNEVNAPRRTIYNQMKKLADKERVQKKTRPRQISWRRSN